jgi:predicted permease
VSALLDVILPVFLVIGFGYVAAWRGLFSESAIDGIMRFAQSFAIPFLLFRSIAKLDLGAAYDTGLMISFYSGALLAGGLGYVVARRVFGRSPTDALAIGFVCSFSNTLLLGLPITELAYGPQALEANYAIISVHAPLLYALGITAMEMLRSHGQGKSKAVLARQVSLAILTQPLLLGILAGVFVNLAGLPLPGVVWTAVDMMVRAALPAALFGLGGTLMRYRPEGDMKTIAAVCAITLIFHPAVTYLMGRFGFGLSVDQMRSAVITAAMAPGVNAYMFANMYGAAKRVAASSVLLATAASILTTWGWLHILP